MRAPTRTVLLILCAFALTGLLAACNPASESQDSPKAEDTYTEPTEKEKEMQELKGVLKEKMAELDLRDSVASELAKTLTWAEIGTIVELQYEFDEKLTKENNIATLNNPDSPIYEMYWVSIRDDKGYSFKFIFTKGEGFNDIERIGPEPNVIRNYSAPVD